MTNFFSKIRRILLLSILTGAFAVLSVLGLVACGNESLTEDDLIEMGYTVVVHFDYNGGSVNSEPSTKLRLKEGSKVPNPGSDANQLANPVRNNYSFKNFVTAKLNENGEARRDESGNIIPDKVWDFNSDIPTGETTLYAQWWDNYKVNFHYGDGLDKVRTSYVSRKIDGSPNDLVSSGYNIDGYTVIDYYFDRDFTDKLPRVPMSMTASMFDDSADGITMDVWCKALEGTYTIVRQASDFPVIKSDTNIYLYNDVTIPDGTKIDFPNGYSGKFIGAGNTIKNLQVSVSSSGGTDFDYGIFKSLDEGAEISDVTFENAKLSVSLSATLQHANIALFAGQINEGAKVSNVKISGSVECEVAVGFTSFDHLEYSDFASSVADSTVTNSGVQGKVDFIKSMAIYTADTNYAAYAKYTESGDDITLLDVYGLASESNGSYTALRHRTITENTYGTTYTLTTSRGNYCIVLTKNADGYAAEVTTSTVVYSEDKNIGVYVKSITVDNKTQIVGVYGMEIKGEDGSYTECEVSAIADNGNSSYTVTTSNAVYTVTVTTVNDAIAVSVATA